MLKQRTTWCGVGVCVLGGYQIFTGDSSNGIQNILLGMGIIFGREAIAEVKK